jgi:hypothetical protein
MPVHKITVMSVRIDQGLTAALTRFHARTGCAPAETVRRALAAYLKRHGVYTPPKKATTSKAKKGKDR